MTSTFNSTLDLVAWCLKGEGLNYAVSYCNGEEYKLTKIRSNGDNNVDDTKSVNIYINSDGVSFPLTISKSVSEIVSKEHILPLMRNIISGIDKSGQNGRIYLRNVLDESKDSFYKPKVGLEMKLPINYNNNNNNNININMNIHNIPNFDDSYSKPGVEDMPRFEDEYELQKGRRHDRFFMPLPEFGDDNNVSNRYRSFGDADLYPNGDRNGQWGSFNPIGGSPMGNTRGGMYPTFDDPLFHPGGNDNNNQPNPRDGKSGTGKPNIRYDEPYL